MDALRGINPHKATGFDGLSPRMLKLVADEIAEPFIQKKNLLHDSRWGSLTSIEDKVVLLHLYFIAVSDIVAHCLCFH